MATSYWLRWTINCAFGEWIGIAFAGVITFSVNYVIGEPGTVLTKFIALLAVHSPA